MINTAFKTNNIKRGKLLKKVRVFEVKVNLPIHTNEDGSKSYIFVKGDILEERFDKPNFLVNITNPESIKNKFKSYINIDMMFINSKFLNYKGKTSSENTEYFKSVGLKRIIEEKERKEKSISNANDRIAEINYFLKK